MRISDWSSDVCSSDLVGGRHARNSLSSPRQARPADLAVIGAVAKVQHLALQIAAGVAATVADVIGQPPAGKLGHRNHAPRYVSETRQLAIAAAIDNRQDMPGQQGRSNTVPQPNGRAEERAAGEAWVRKGKLRGSPDKKKK